MYVVSIDGLIITNILIEDNEVQNESGGLTMKSVTNMLLQDSIFRNNRARSGGALKADSMFNGIYTNLILEHNYAYIKGGGLWDIHGRNITIQKCRIYNNTAKI